MVTSKDEKVVWILDLVGKKQANSLERLLSTINVVSQEQIIASWWKSPVFKKPEKIVVLAVNVTADLDWSFNF